MYTLCSSGSTVSNVAAQMYSRIRCVNCLKSSAEPHICNANAAFVKQQQKTPQVRTVSCKDQIQTVYPGLPANWTAEIWKARAALASRAQQPPLDRAEYSYM